MLRFGLEIADRVARRLPRRVAYGLADVAGDAWYRLAPSRRRLVAGNLRRVCAATGRPTSGSAFRALVRAAFRHHARYYLELLRVPHYPEDEVDQIVAVDDWPAYEAAIRGRAAVFVTGHVGNFEPFGVFLGVRGIRPLAPIEQIEPKALYEFLAERRGGGRVELVPVRTARRALARRLAEGGLVGIVGDRDLTGGGLDVPIFGHLAPIPTGPAGLAIMSGAVVLAGRCLRTGPERFQAAGEIIPLPDSGNRKEDVEALTRAIAACYERAIGEAPEQWWGSFQPFWPDLDPRTGTAATT